MLLINWSCLSFPIRQKDQLIRPAVELLNNNVADFDTVKVGLVKVANFVQCLSRNYVNFAGKSCSTTDVIDTCTNLNIYY